MNTEGTIEIKLTKKQAKELRQALHDYRDEGPLGEEWSSDKLMALREVVDLAISQAEKGAKT